MRPSRPQALAPRTRHSLPVVNLDFDAPVGQRRAEKSARRPPETLPVSAPPEGAAGLTHVALRQTIRLLAPEAD